MDYDFQPPSQSLRSFLVHLALVCKGFYDTTIRRLWARLDSFDVLLRTLSPISVEERECFVTSKYTYTRRIYVSLCPICSARCACHITSYKIGRRFHQASRLVTGVGSRTMLLLSAVSTTSNYQPNVASGVFPFPRTYGRSCCRSQMGSRSCRSFAQPRSHWTKGALNSIVFSKSSPLDYDNSKWSSWSQEIRSLTNVTAQRCSRCSNRPRVSNIFTSCGETRERIAQVPTLTFSLPFRHSRTYAFSIRMGSWKVWTGFESWPPAQYSSI